MANKIYILPNKVRVIRKKHKLAYPARVCGNCDFEIGINCPISKYQFKDRTGLCFSKSKDYTYHLKIVTNL